MKQLFEELDDLINQSINEVFSDDERMNQKKQFAVVKQMGLQVKKKKEEKKKDEDFEESDEEPLKKDDKEIDKKQDQTPKKSEKLTGDTQKVLFKKQKQDDETNVSKQVPGTPTSKDLHDPTQEQLLKPDFKSIAKNINLLRGGKSLRDTDVQKNIKDYISRLDGNDKKDFLVYLNSLAQIMAGKKSGKDAVVNAPQATDKKEKLAIDTKVANEKEKATKKDKSNVIIVGG